MHIVGFWIVQPEMRTPAFRAHQRGFRLDASQQHEVAPGQRALQFGAAQAVRTARLFVQPHGGSVVMVEAFVLRLCLLERLLVADRAELIVRQHAASRAHVGLQRTAVATHQVSKPRSLGFGDGAVFRA
jgi:hypothetical protein